MDWCICSLIKEDGRYQGRFGRWFLADGWPRKIVVSQDVLVWYYLGL